MAAMPGRRTASFWLLATALFAALAFAVADIGRPGAGVDYDYLALVLAWSPSFCASEAGRDAKQQCAAGRRYGFTVHGLWPEYRRGFPQYCASDEGFVPDALIAGMRDLMPSKGLVIHEWKRHGTCSGLGQRGYFSAIRALFSRLRIPARYVAPETAIMISPAELTADFLSANPWLSADTISVRCESESDGARLDEIVLCFSRAFEPRPCGDNERRRCAAAELTLPPVR